MPVTSQTHLVHREHGKHGLDRPRRAEQVSDRTLGAAHVDLRGTGFALRSEEERLDRVVFGRVAKRRRGRVRVDVVDGRRLRLRVRECALHGAQGAAAVRQRRRQVVRVGGAAVARHFGVDARAAREGVVEVFEHEHRRALADDEAAPRGVEGPRGECGRLVVGCCEGARTCEAADGEWVDARFGRAGHHNRGVTKGNETCGVADGVQTGRAGCCRGVVGALEEVSLLEDRNRCQGVEVP